MVTNKSNTTFAVVKEPVNTVKLNGFPCQSNDSILEFMYRLLAQTLELHQFSFRKCLPLTSDVVREVAIVAQAGRRSR
jgi:hypothetical protein